MKKQIYLLALIGILAASLASAEDLVVYHAGSLTGAMKAMSKAFTDKTSLSIKLVGGGSGSLRQRIEKGERPDVFASADMENPAALAKSGLAGQPVVFTRNTLCAIARTSLALTPANFLDRLLDPAVKVGTSTPVLDPSGDYAWKMFDRADQAKAGSAALLKVKAIKLMGDPALPVPPKTYTKSLVTWLFEDGKADVFLVYQSAAKPVINELAGQVKLFALPEELSVSAQYGVSTITGAKPEAAQFVAFILSDSGQKILVGNGFLSK